MLIVVAKAEINGLIKWDNIIWALKHIKAGRQKVLFEPLNKFLGVL
jgi:hypothetical protein